MERLFISGSRSITTLTAMLRETLDKVMSQSPTVMIGDADGADALVQNYLADKGYRNVIVCHSGYRLRNCIGDWPTQLVESTARPGTREFYTAKDVVMADAATIGLALWDGMSRGALRNMIHMGGQEKAVAVFLTQPDSLELAESRGDLQKIIRAWSR